MTILEIPWAETTAPAVHDHVRSHIDMSLYHTNPVAVFDVDETLLFNHDDDEDTIAVNGSVKPIYDYLLKNKIPMYIVTARQKSGSACKYVTRQLRALGYTGFKGVFMTPREYMDDPDPGKYKFDARAFIRNNGETIILNVGDQITDHVGSHQSIKYPIRKDFYYGLRDPDHPSMMSVKLPQFD